MYTKREKKSLKKSGNGPFVWQIKLNSVGNSTILSGVASNSSVSRVNNISILVTVSLNVCVDWPVPGYTNQLQSTQIQTKLNLEDAKAPIWSH